MAFGGHLGWVWSVAFRPDGARLASGGEDQFVRIWEVNTGQCLTTLQGPTDGIRSVAFSPDGARLASSSDDGTVRLWEVSTGQCLATLQGYDIGISRLQPRWHPARQWQSRSDGEVGGGKHRKGPEDATRP